MKWAEAAAGAVGMAALAAALVAIPASGAESSDVVIDQSGITLPAGDTFLAGESIGFSGSAGTAGYVLETQCVDSDTGDCAGEGHAVAQYIGASFIPWSALGMDGDFCITWVNLSQYAETYYTGSTDARCAGDTGSGAGSEPTGGVLGTGEETAEDTATDADTSGASDVTSADSAAAVEGDATYTG